MKIKNIILSSVCAGAMLGMSVQAQASVYSGEVALANSIHDFRRIDVVTGTDSMYGATSLQSQPGVFIYNAIEIQIMDSGVEVDNRNVQGKPCPEGTSFNAFVTPLAMCSATYGRNFSGFMPVAVETTEGKWKPVLYMNVGGKWRELDGEVAQCKKVLVQKMCQ